MYCHLDVFSFINTKTNIFFINKKTYILSNLHVYKLFFIYCIYITINTQKDGICSQNEHKISLNIVQIECSLNEHFPKQRERISVDKSTVTQKITSVLGFNLVQATRLYHYGNDIA